MGTEKALWLGREVFLVGHARSVTISLNHLGSTVDVTVVGIYEAEKIRALAEKIGVEMDRPDFEREFPQTVRIL